MSDICLMTKSWRYSAGWIAQMIAQAIAEEGAKITFVAPLAEPESREPRHRNLTRVRTPRELVGRHGRLRRAVASLARVGAGLFNLLRLRPSTRNYIFTIPEPLVFTLPLFALLRLSGARVVYIVHDAVPHAWSLPQRLRALEKASHGWAYGLASMIVTLTPTVGDALSKQFGVPGSKLAVIPHGPLSLGDVAPMPGSHKLLLFGALRKNKGVLDVVKGVLLARRQGLPVRLVLAGEPLKQEVGYWDECLSEMARDAAGFDVRVGFVPDEALPDLIAEVDAFMLAYRDFESQSGVGVLAALAGRPVIGSRAGGLGELFDIGMVGVGLDEPVTEASIAAAIASFYEQPMDHWRAQAAEGRAKVAHTLRWDTIAQRYIEIACQPR